MTDAPPLKTTVAPRAFTLRAVLLGLLSAWLVCASAYSNDFGLGFPQSAMIGNHLPTMIYAGFFVFLLCFNPLLVKFGGRRAFGAAVAGLALASAGMLSYLLDSYLPILAGVCTVAAVVLFSVGFKVASLRPFAKGELVVMLTLPLVAGALPVSGLMRFFPQALVMPDYHGKASVDWQKANPKNYVDKRLFPLRDRDGRVYDDYVQGMHPDSPPPLSQTSLRAWTRGTKEKMLHHGGQTPWSGWTGWRFLGHDAPSR